MPKAHDIATELRKLADALDVQPELEMRKLWIDFYCSTKEEFLNAAAIMPRPFVKSESQPSSPEWNRIAVDHKTQAVEIKASVLKSLTCELVEPAKPAIYRCDPILSALEEAQLNTEVL